MRCQAASHLFWNRGIALSLASLKQINEGIKAPIGSSRNIVGDLQEEALGHLPAFEAVLYAKVAALVMIMRIEGTGIIRTGAEWSTRHHDPSLS